MKLKKDIFKNQKEFKFLSNMYLCKIEYNNYIFPSSENLYQFMKIPDELKDKYIDIYTNVSPEKSKWISRKNPIREDWDKIKINVMYNVLKLKFNQHKDLKEKLIQIEGPIIEWTTWNDTFWGIDLKTEKGNNWLGKLLMQLRNEYKLFG